jgi:hypothetical protein
MVLISIQPLIEMSTGDILGGERRLELKADILTPTCEPIF